MMSEAESRRADPHSLTATNIPYLRHALCHVYEKTHVLLSKPNVLPFGFSLAAAAGS